MRDELPAVIGDAVQIADVFQNLLVNAVKYRRPGQALEVQISAVDGRSGRSDDQRSR